MRIYPLCPECGKPLKKIYESRKPLKLKRWIVLKSKRFMCENCNSYYQVRLIKEYVRPNDFIPKKYYRRNYEI